MANFTGKKIRVELNGHDVSHLTGVSINDVGLIMDTFQVLNDNFDHEIEMEEEASGTFDIVASDASEGRQNFKEMMQYVFGYIDIDRDITITLATTGVNTTSDVITSAAHGFTDTSSIFYNEQGGTVLAGLAADTGYFARDATTDTFKVAATSGGSAINLTGTGNNSQTFSRGDTDTFTVTSEDFTELDTQGDYTGSRLLTHFKRISTKDSYIDFVEQNDTAWIKFRALGETIDALSLAWSSTGGSGGQTCAFSYRIFDGLTITGTADSGTTTKLVDTSELNLNDDYLIGATIKFGGDQAGNSRVITDSATSDDSVSFAALASAVTGSTTYTITDLPSDNARSSEATSAVDYNRYNGAVATWKDEPIPADWADDLTIGTDYWLKIVRTTATGQNTARLGLDSTGPLTHYGDLWIADSSSSAAVGEKQGGAAGVSEAVHYIRFKKSEGLKVVVYDYIDEAETGGLKWTFNKVKLESVTPSFASKQATRGSISWKCNEWSFDEI